jgi:hypothetical protein
MIAKVFARTSKLSRNFSSLGGVAENNYSRFRTAYVNNLGKFKETMETVENTESAATLKNKKAYVHPFDNEHYTVNMNPAKASEIFFEFVGPEQVSPHYESFLASRKWAIGFWATSITLAYVGSSVDFHWVARSCIIPFTFYATSFYWILEGRKHIVK